MSIRDPLAGDHAERKILILVTSRKPEVTIEEMAVESFPDPALITLHSCYNPNSDQKVGCERAKMARMTHRENGLFPSYGSCTQSGTRWAEQRKGRCPGFESNRSLENIPLFLIRGFDDVLRCFVVKHIAYKSALRRVA